MNFYELALFKFAEKVEASLIAHDPSLNTGKYITTLDLTAKKCKITVVYDERRTRTFNVDFALFNEAERIFAAMETQISYMLIGVQNGERNIKYYNHSNQQIQFTGK